MNSWNLTEVSRSAYSYEGSDTCKWILGGQKNYTRNNLRQIHTLKRHL